MYDNPVLAPAPYLEDDQAVVEVGIEIVDSRLDTEGVHPVAIHLQEEGGSRMRKWGKGLRQRANGEGHKFEKHLEVQ